MKYCLVADDGQARVVVAECEEVDCIQDLAWAYSEESESVKIPCKFHVCRREPSPSGDHLVTIETWEKGVKL